MTVTKPQAQMLATLAAARPCPVCSGSAPRPQWITDLFESGAPDE